MNEPIGPAKCPITGLPFFMNIEHPELGMIATYGGPFDSYTIPTADDDDEGCFRSERFDHDVGGWIEGGEPWPLHRVTADEFVEHYEWRDQRDEWKKQCDFASEGQAAALAEVSRLTQAANDVLREERETVTDDSWLTAPWRRLIKALGSTASGEVNG